MKILVTGSNGQLGHDCMNELKVRNHDAIGVDIEEMDITVLASVEKELNEIKPEAVIHCAAWTAVDDAEDEGKKEKVHLINAIGTENIAKICKQLGCKMMYISTDYVFDGKGQNPWQPDCKDFKPLNVYGRTKLDGEFAVSRNLNNYFMLKLGKNSDKITVVKDQIGTPTYTIDLARLLIDMIESEKYGYYHATNEGGYISWYDFTKEIFRQAVALGHAEYSEDKITVIPVTTTEYGVSKASRPFNSRLDKSKLIENGFTPLPTWQDAVKRYIQDLEF